MGDFQTFITAVRDGNLGLTINSFKPHFLEWRDYKDYHRNRPIHWACWNGNLEMARFFLQNNCDIESENKWGQRPIHLACMKGYLNIVKLLVQYDCELDCRTQNGDTPMDIARTQDCENFLHEILKPGKIFDCVRRNDVQALSTLFSPDILMIEVDTTGFTILEVAMQLNSNEIVDYLLNDAYVDDEENYSSYWFSEHKSQALSTLMNYIQNCQRSDAVQLIQECLLYRSIRFHNADEFYLFCSAKTINGHGKLIKSSFLEVAAEFDCKPFIHSLLKKSVYNEEEWTKAKNLAMLKGHTEIAVAISKRKSLLKRRADENFTLLHSAICDNDPDMVKYIIENQLVNPNSNNEVIGTGLALAHMMCYADCIEVLEKFNVDVNTQNKYSQSPLHEAIASGMTDHCSYLISRVQDIDRPGYMGFTPLQCAVIKGCEELCDMLMKNGTDCVRYVEILQQSPINQTVLPISKRENAVTLCIKMHKTIYPCFLEVLDLDKIKCSDGHGNSLLHLAAQTLQPDLCNTLMKSGLSVESLNNQGNSPLLELIGDVRNGKINDVIVNILLRSSYFEQNIEKTTETLNILIDSGADVNKVSNSGINVLEVVSQLNSERLMLSILSKQPKGTCISLTEFKVAIKKHWFEYATTLISFLDEDLLKSYITKEMFQLAMTHSAPKLLMSLFVKSSSKVQQSVVEDLLDHFASIDKYDEFLDLLNTEIVNPQFLSNGETLLTNLIKKNNLKYCLPLINFAINKKCIGMTNAINQTPLVVAIESELFDLINPLINNCDDQSNVEFNWHTPLIPLFQKLSMSTNNIVDQKLLTAIKSIISRGGDIYAETVGRSTIIDYCTRVDLKDEIKLFQNNERFKEHDEKNICSIFLVKKVDCAFPCCHVFCMDCGTQLSRCAMCNLEVSKPIKLYFN